MSRVPTFLKVMSVLVIIVGIGDIIVGLVGATVGGVLTYAGAAIGFGRLMWLGVLVVILSLLGGILQLLAGIFSVFGRRLGFCMTLGIVFVIISVVVLVLALYSPATLAIFTAPAIISLVFNVLYIWSVAAGRKRIG